jgi:hypothetical protein
MSQIGNGRAIAADGRCPGRRGDGARRICNTSFLLLRCLESDAALIVVAPC